MNFPYINANAAVLIGIAFFLLANVAIVLTFRHVKQRKARVGLRTQTPGGTRDV